MQVWSEAQNIQAGTRLDIYIYVSVAFKYTIL